MADSDEKRLKNLRPNTRRKWEAIADFFNDLYSKPHPKTGFRVRYEDAIKETSETYFVTPRTVEDIIRWVGKLREDDKQNPKPQQGTLI